MSGDLTVDTNTLKVDSTNNRVGIGTSSPASLGANITTLEITGGSTIRTGGIYLSNSDKSVKSSIYGSNTATNLGTETNIPLVLLTNNTERMRIDSSGNVLVGKTSANTSTVGAELRPDGLGSFTRSGTYPIIANRTTSDGDIISIRKDGTIVGTIGSLSSALVLESNSNTGYIKAGGSIQYNWSIYDFSAQSDNGRDLGKASKRWKDLYLGGGLYIGGTGTANKLDDYEEGTWTPTWNATGTTPTVTHTAQNGTYTKVGRLVTVKGRVTTNSSGISGGSGDLSITGLPFTSSSESDNGAAAISFVSFISLNSNYTTFGIEATKNTTYLRVLQYGSNNSGLTVSVGNASSSQQVNIGFIATYFTA